MKFKAAFQNREQPTPLAGIVAAMRSVHPVELWAKVFDGPCGGWAKIELSLALYGWHMRCCFILTLICEGNPIATAQIWKECRDEQQVASYIEQAQAFLIKAKIYLPNPLLGGRLERGQS